jgi:hypothetical protein
VAATTPLPLAKRAKPTAHAYRDVAVALAWIATDATTKTPARLDENGPWWKATMADSPTVTVHVRPACPDHPRHQSLGCPECAAQVGDADSGLAAVRAAIRRTR